jgi:exonuclease III
VKLVSWNTARRVKRTEDQFAFLRKFEADIVALQEIIPSSEIKWRERLSGDYAHIISSFELAPNVEVLKKKRMFGQIIASKFPLTPIPPDQMQVPWQERVLSVQLHTPERNIRLLTTYIPPGASNGWIKIATLKGIIENRFTTFKQGLGYDSS